ncbi:hypothetical protein YQE_07738, partial [Dendroctonus ponderosae]
MATAPSVSCLPHNAKMSKAKKVLDEAREIQNPELDLFDKNVSTFEEMTGLPVPPGLANLSNLEIINLANNQIEELPLSLSSMPKLRILNLSINKLYSLPRGFGAFPVLEVLDLTYNNLKEDALPGNFFLMGTLRALYLGDNDFEYLPPEIKNLKNLEILGLRENDLLELPKEIGELTRLKELHLQGNRLTFLPPDLGQLDMSSNKAAFRLEGNKWIPPIADQLQLGISHLQDYLKSETYRITYNRCLTNKPEAPPPFHYLEQNEVFKFNPNPYSNRQLYIYCYQGTPKYVIHVWQSVLLKIDHSTQDYNQFDGNTPEQVQQEYVDQRHSWSINLFAIKSKSIKLNPFNCSCVGIESRDAYSVHLQVIRVDLWRILAASLGVMLFFSAASLSRNTLFHYLCGISFGICASFLILIYLISKLFPRKTLMYGVIGAGWTIVIYFLQIMCDNIKLITSTYQAYVIWYTVITGAISFVLCYRWGPVQNPRTITLIKWTLQLMGLVTIYLSSCFQEAAMGQIILLLLMAGLPKRWLNAPLMYWKKKFPPKVKLLTNEEYYMQGVSETTKALEELRQFCSSPNCNQWKTALKVKDVKRFASFVEGNSHLTDEEILEYETSIQYRPFADEEDSVITSDEGW